MNPFLALLDHHLIAEIDRVKNGTDLMVSVRSLAEDLKEQVEFRGGKNANLPGLHGCS